MECCYLKENQQQTQGVFRPKIKDKRLTRALLKSAV